MAEKIHLILDDLKGREINSSQGVIAGNLLFIGGISSRDLVTKDIRGSSLIEQCRYAFETLNRILKKANLTFSDIVKLNVYLSDASSYDSFNKIYKRYFKSPYPARLVLVQQLFPNTLIELESIALIG
jgi:2-iminobutanoate/2-iminopropanoate deaminase